MADIVTEPARRVLGRLGGRDPKVVEEEEEEEGDNPNYNEPQLASATQLAMVEDVPKVEGDDTNYASYFKAAMYSGMAFQSAYGILAFLYIIMQYTRLGAFNIAATYTSLMGVVYIAVVGITVFFPSVIRPKYEKVWTFIAFFTLMYAITVAWMFMFEKRNPTFNFHHDRNHSPLPLTMAFLPYVGLSVWTIFSTIFYLMFAFAVMNQKTSEANADKARWIGMDEVKYGWSNKAMQVFGLLALFTGALYGMLQFFWLLDFNSGTLWGPQALFILYSFFFLVQSGFHVYISWNVRSEPNPITGGNALIRSANKLVNTVFMAHWEEIDRVIFFEFLMFVVNLGFWARIWALDGVHYTSRLKFGGSPETVYFALVANAAISTIAVPMFGHYFVTFLCFTQYVIASDKEYSMITIGFASIFSAVGVDTVAIYKQLFPGTETTPPKGEEIEFGVKKERSVTRALQFTFVLAAVACFISTFILFFDLVNGGSDPHSGHFLNPRFKRWEWSEIFMLNFFWFVFFAYAVITVAMMYFETGVASGYNNALALCMFGRPLVNLALLNFIVSFGYGWVYHKHGVGQKIPRVLTSDPTNPVSVLYWSILFIAFGMFIPNMIALKDMLSSLSGLMFVMSENTKERIKVLYNTGKARGE